jgi:glycerol-3-phosphate dehydrogenase
MRRDLIRLSQQVYDVLVIGGGIYGVCVARDAALRGLSVALVEQGDFGHATSFNSLRILHGGFRYLQHGDIRRMRRSIHERSVFMRTAPHLVHPLPFLIPTYGHGLRGKEILSLALLLNDCIGYDRNRQHDPLHYLPRGRVISRQECLRLAPGLEAPRLTGGAILYDGQIANSERLILAVLRSAAMAGAHVANYTQVTGFLTEKARIASVAVRDLLAGETFDIRARMVINTSGPWVRRVAELLDERHPKHPLLFSKAFNLLLKRQLIPHYAVGVYSQGPFRDRDAFFNKGARLLFMTPWQGRSLIGTAHLPYDADADDPSVTEAEVQAFLDEINAAYPMARLTRQDVCCAYGGLLPATGYHAGEVQITKRHWLHDHRSEARCAGLISVLGVKLTEARYVAEQAVDLVFRKFGQIPPASVTAVTPVYGGQIECLQTFVSQEVRRAPQGLDAEVIEALIGRYGTAYSEVLQYYFPASPSAAGALEPLRCAEVLHATRQEMAQKLTDVVFRRTILGTFGNPGDALLSHCAALMAQELGWSDTHTAKEVQEVQTRFAART